MGNTPTTLTQQQLSQSLRQQYSIQEKPYLLQRKTGKPYTLHKITTYSYKQTQSIIETINNYKTSRCSSISMLKTHLKRKDKSYCSDQEIIYLIFHDHGRNTLKDQYLIRRLNEHNFDPLQIISILKTMLCGVRQYYKHFQRKFDNFSLESVCIQPNTNKMYVRDPWLTNLDMSKSRANIHLSYPSLQKLRTLYVDKNYVYDQYYSELFSIGMYGLQLFHMDFVDKIYRSKTSDYDRNALDQLIKTIYSPQLRNGLEILLADQPDKRDYIFKFWNIQCSQNYELKYLERVEANKSIKARPLQNKQDRHEFSQQPNRITTATFDNNHGHMFYQAPMRDTTVTFGNGHIHPVHLNSPPNFPISQHVNEGYYRSQPINYSQSSYTKTVWKNQNDIARNIPRAGPTNVSFINENQNQRKISKVVTKSMEKPTNYSQSGYPSFSKQNNLNQQKVYFQQNTSRMQAYPGIINQPINISYYQKKGGQSSSLSKYVPTNYSGTSRNRSHSTKQQIIGVNPQRQRSQSQNQNYSSFKVSLNKQPQSYQQNKINFNQTQPNVGQNLSSYQKPTYQFYSESRSKTNSENIARKQQPIVQSVPLQNNFYQSSSYQKPVQNFSSFNQKNYQYNQQNKNKFSLDSKDYYENRITSIDTAGVSNVKEQPQLKPKQMSISPINEWKSQPQPIQYKSNINFQSTDDNFKRFDQVYQMSKNYETNFKEKNNQNYNGYQQQKKQKPNSPNLTIDMTIKPMNIINKDKSPKTTKEQVQSNVTPFKNPPTAKYNSTIVEVNQQTPQGSQQSIQRDQQYVVEEYQSGSRYEGFKVNGMRHGRGKFYYQDGGHYQGQWKRNKMHGWGKLFYQGGRLAYEGHWKADQFHGSGKVYNDNPIPLSYPFDYTNFDLLDDYWIYYQGTLVSDTKQGRGKIKLTNGQYFEGDFHADRIQGFGKYYTIDGNFIQGIWRDSKLIKVLNSS